MRGKLLGVSLAVLGAMAVAVSQVAMDGSRAAAQTREERVRSDRKKVEAGGFWIYGDLAKGFSEAKATGKPLLVVLRCLPCVECVKLDDDLINSNEQVRPLLEKFVRVRVVSTNGLDLTTFQFDTDQSFAVFFLNADGTVYGRFGTRSHRTLWTDDVSIEGLARALEGALELHRGYPANREQLAGKRGPTPSIPTPEKFPSFEGKYTGRLDYEGNVLKGCIHCHMIGDAQREAVFLSKKPLPIELIFPFPHPKSVGIVFEPKERATVLRVEKGSPAEASGFRAGDVVRTLAGQPLLSIADVQWVLQNANPEGAKLRAEVERGGAKTEVTLDLPPNWKARDSISWRASSWELRRRATGGMLLDEANPEQRAKLAVPEGKMALRVEHVGEYSPHDAAKKAGFRKGDFIVAFDSRRDLLRETDVLAYVLRSRKPGDRIALEIVRNGAPKEMSFEVQP